MHFKTTCAKFLFCMFAVQVAGTYPRCHFRHFKVLLSDDLCRQRLPKNPSEDLQRHIFEHLDGDSNGYIEYDEFKTGFGDLISEDGQFTGFNHKDFSDACLRSLVVEVENLVGAASSAALDHEHELHHAHENVLREKEFSATVEKENEQLREEIDDLNDRLEHSHRNRRSSEHDVTEQETEITSLRERVKTLTAEKISLEKNNQSQAETIRLLGIANDTLTSQLSESERQMSDVAVMITEHAAMQAKIDGYEEQISRLNGMLHAKDETAQNLSNEITAMDETATELRKKLLLEEKERAGIMSDLAAERAQSQQLAARVLELETKKNELTRRTLDLQAEADRLKDELNLRPLLATINAEEEKVANLTKLVSDIRQECTNLKREVTSANLRATDMESLSNKNWQAHQNALEREQELRQELVDAKAQLERMRKLSRRAGSIDKSKVSELERQTEKLHADVAHLKNLLSDAENNLAQQARLSTMLSGREEKLKSEIAQLTSACQAKDDKIKLLKREAKNTAAAMAKLEETNAAALSEAASLREERVMATAYAKANEELDSTRQKLQDAETEKNRVKAELDDVTTQLCLEKEHVKLLETRVADLEARAKEDARQRSELEEALDVAKHNLGTLSQHDRDEATEVARLTQLVEELRSERTELKSLLVSANETVDNAKLEGDRLRASYEATQTQLSDAQDTIKTQAAALTKATTDASNGARLNLTLSENVNHLEARVEELSRTIRSRDNEIVRLQDGVRRIKTQYEMRLRTGEDAKRQLIEREKVNRALTEEITSMKAELQRLKSEKAQYVMRARTGDDAKRQKLELETAIKKMSNVMNRMKDQLQRSENENPRLNAEVQKSSEELLRFGSVADEAHDLQHQIDHEKQLQKTLRTELEETQLKLREALQLVAHTAGELDCLKGRVDNKSQVLNQHFLDLSSVTQTSPPSRPSRAQEIIEGRSPDSLSSPSPRDARPTLPTFGGLYGSSSADPSLWSPSSRGGMSTSPLPQLPPTPLADWSISGTSSRKTFDASTLPSTRE